jgi:hypothetical protein
VCDLVAQRDQCKVGCRNWVSELRPTTQAITPESAAGFNRAFDTDGEFLLIEAAEALPSWVKPTNSENRVRPWSSGLVRGYIVHISLSS